MARRPGPAPASTALLGRAGGGVDLERPGAGRAGTAAIPTPPAAAWTSSRSPGPRPGQVHQRVPGGRERHRHRRRLRERPARRDRRPAAARRRPPPARTRRRPGPAPGPRRARPVTPARSPVTTPATSLPSSAPARVHAQRDQHVPEVQPGRPDRDPHLPGASGPGRLRARDQRQAVQRPAPGGLQPPRLPAGGGTGGPAGRRASRRRQHRGPRRTASSRLAPSAQRARQRPATDACQPVQVGQHQPARVLRLRRPHQPPHRRPGQVRHAARPGPAATAPRSPPPAATADSRSRPATPAPAPAPRSRPGAPPRPRRRPRRPRRPGRQAMHHDRGRCRRPPPPARPGPGSPLAAPGRGQPAAASRSPPSTAHRPPPARGPRDRDPVHAEQRVPQPAPGRRQLPRRHRPQHQRVRRDHRRPGRVGRHQRQPPRPAGRSRTRSADAPAACSDTPVQANGSRTSPALRRRRAAALQPAPAACSAASSSAGCTPNPPASPAAPRGSADLGEDVVPAPPGRPQPAERRPVPVARLRPVRRTARRPHRHRPAGGHTASSGHAAGPAGGRLAAAPARRWHAASTAGPRWPVRPGSTPHRPAARRPPGRPP